MIIVFLEIGLVMSVSRSQLRGVETVFQFEGVMLEGQD